MNSLQINLADSQQVEEKSTAIINCLDQIHNHLFQYINDLQQLDSHFTNSLCDEYLIKIINEVEAFRTSVYQLCSSVISVNENIDECDRLSSVNAN